MDKQKPKWLTIRIPGGEGYQTVRETLKEAGLETVCEHARCPNLGECWSRGTATFMILGSTCTRGCRFCAVGVGRRPSAIDKEEPERVARAASAMGLRHAVVTSVTRDDLPDGGASIFAAAVRTLKALVSPPSVELLIPDLLDEPLRHIVDAGPDVLAHNIEVVDRLTPMLRHRSFSYARSLKVLEQAKQMNGGLITKSSLMLGVGEEEEEVMEAMCDLRRVGVDILVLGQYLRPTRESFEVVKFITPEQFLAFRDRAMTLGFRFAAASPLARTSYKAREAYEACVATS